MVPNFSKIALSSYISARRKKTTGQYRHVKYFINALVGSQYWSLENPINSEKYLLRELEHYWKIFHFQ